MDSKDMMNASLENLVRSLTQAEFLVATIAYFAGNRFDLVPKDLWMYPYAIGSNDISVMLKRKGFISKVGHAEMHDAYRITEIGKIIMARYASSVPELKTLLDKLEELGLENVLETVMPTAKEELSKYAKVNPRSLLNTWDNLNE